MELYDNTQSSNKVIREAEQKQQDTDAINNFFEAIKHRYKDVVTTFNAKDENLKMLESLQVELKSEEATVIGNTERAGHIDGDKTAAHIKFPEVHHQSY